MSQNRDAAPQATPVSSSTTTIARDSAQTFIFRLLILALTITTGIITARWLGPAGRGVYTGVNMVVGIVMLAASGIGTAITYAVTKKRQPLSELIPALAILLVGLSILSTVGGVVWSFFRGWSPVVWLFIAAVPPSTLLAWQGGVYTGLGRIRNLNMQTTGLACATLVSVTIAVIVLRGGAVAALIAWLLSLYLAAFVFVVHSLRLAWGPYTAPLGVTVRMLTNFGGQSAINAFLGAVNYRIDSIILMAMLGAASFGIYSIAVSFGELLFTLTRAVTTAATRHIGTRDLPGSASITAKVVRMGTAVVAAFAVVAFVAGPALIDLVFGARFSGAATPLRILLPGIVVFSTAGTFAAFFIIQLGKPVIVTLTNVVMILIQAAACWILVPRFGMGGAAFASTVTYIAGALLNTIWFCRTTGTRMRDVWILRPSDVVTLRDAVHELVGRKTAARFKEAV